MFALRLCGYGHLCKDRKDSDYIRNRQDGVERSREIDREKLQEQFTIEYWATRAIVSLLQAPSRVYVDQSAFQETGPIILWATDVFERCTNEEVLALTRKVCEAEGHCCNKL
jgi:hypothetical protein